MKYDTFFYLLILIFPFQMAKAQQDQFNYDESKVPDYKLPLLFETDDGKKIETVSSWKYKRRPEIIRLFEDNVYGQVPDHYDGISYDVVNENKNAINGSAHLKEVDVSVNRNGQSVTIRLNLFIPNNVPKPAPVFLLINHRGPENIDPTRRVIRDFWPVEEIISRGYAIGAFQVGDVANDDADTYKNGILEKLYPEQIGKNNGMRALSAWAWGAMRIMDYFMRDPDIDQNRSVIVGHSRGGKAALWTGAQDQRFAITISNESGCGGAALSRRRFGETVQRINNSFPHWFTPNFNKYNENESELPVDQHMLIALMAPRPVYVASAQEDEWADPRGEFLSLRHGARVLEEIYQMPVNLPSEMPGVNNPTIESFAGHHMREGEHDLTVYDWQRFMDFADYHFKLGKHE
jgi:hypothetical protein